MQTTVYVSNLPYSATDADLQTYFSVFGAIKTIKMLTDRDTGRPRGIAFVEYLDEATATNAIEGTDKRDFMGRALNVSLARPKGQKPERTIREARAPREYSQDNYREYSQPEMSWHDPNFDSYNKRDRRDRRDNRRKYDR